MSESAEYGETEGGGAVRGWHSGIAGTQLRHQLLRELTRERPEADLCFETGVAQ